MASDGDASGDMRAGPLATRHAALGATMGPFAGWSMPIRYGSIADEHRAVREDVGVFDVSHLGTVLIEGPGAAACIAGSFTNDPSPLTDGTSQYTLCCDERGGVIDDLIVYRLGMDRWLAVPNAANTTAVVETLRSVGDDLEVRIRDESTAWAVLAVQGPRSLPLVDDALHALGAESGLATATRHLGVREIELDAGGLVLARTGYTGERGVELLIPNAHAGRIWDVLTQAGATPVGLGARDTLRLEVGFPLHGQELSTEHSPYDARLGWAVKLERGPFQGRDALREAKQRGPGRRLLGVLPEGRRPARAGMQVLRDGVVVGETTSGTLSPTLERPIALAYLDTEVAPGAAVMLDLRGREVGATVITPPFLERDPR